MCFQEIQDTCYLHNWYNYQRWFYLLTQAVAEVVDAGPNAMYKPGQPVMYLQYGAFRDYMVNVRYDLLFLVTFCHTCTFIQHNNDTELTYVSLIIL